MLKELFPSVTVHFNQLNLFILSNIWISICIHPALQDENTLSDKAGKNGQKQYKPSARERQKKGKGTKKNPHTTKTPNSFAKEVFALYCSASFPPVLATAPGAANQRRGGEARASSPGYLRASPASNRAGPAPAEQPHRYCSAPAGDQDRLFFSDSSSKD